MSGHLRAVAQVRGTVLTLALCRRRREKVESLAGVARLTCSAQDSRRGALAADDGALQGGGQSGGGEIASQP